MKNFKNIKEFLGHRDQEIICLEDNFQEKTADNMSATTFIINKWVENTLTLEKGNISKVMDISRILDIIKNDDKITSRYVLYVSGSKNTFVLYPYESKMDNINSTKSAFILKYQREEESWNHRDSPFVTDTGGEFVEFTFTSQWE